MSRACRASAAAFASLLLPLAAQEAGTPPLEASQVRSVEDLLRYVRQREGAVESVEMAIESSGTMPDGSEFHSKGTLRVLGTTHFHATMAAEFGEGMETETETVRTPDGIWMRERDPVQGEIYLRMDRALMERVDAATKALGGDAAAAGFGSREASSPLGAALLEDLAAQFDLSLREPQVVDGQRCWVVGGPLRGGATPGEDPFGLNVDQVDVLVRSSDGAVVRMPQFHDGRPMLDVRIPRLEFDRPFEESSFALAVPEKATVIPVLEHPPSAAQIERLLAEAKEQGWQDPAGDEVERPRADQDR